MFPWLWDSRHSTLDYCWLICNWLLEGQVGWQAPSNILFLKNNRRKNGTLLVCYRSLHDLIPSYQEEGRTHCSLLYHILLYFTWILLFFILSIYLSICVVPSCPNPSLLHPVIPWHMCFHWTRTMVVVKGYPGMVLETPFFHALCIPMGILQADSNDIGTAFPQNNQQRSLVMVMFTDKCHLPTGMESTTQNDLPLCCPEFNGSG